MEFNYNQIPQKTMASSVSSLCEAIDKILSTHCKLNKIAMSKMQSMGYNGFKRWHRYRSNQFFELRLKLSTEVYDKFRITPVFKDYDVTYEPMSMEEHLKSWDKALLEAVEELGSINKAYYEYVGRDCCIIQKAICIIMKDYEKVGKYLKRFSDSDWLALDMHLVDDKLHDKYKHKEEKHGKEY